MNAKRTKVKLLSLALAAVLMLGMMPVMTVWADGTHTHNGITFTEWESTDSLPSMAGSYCLTTDVTLTGQWNVPDGTTNLCLNGHSITQTSNTRVINIPSGATLNLFDCSSDSAGKITGGNLGYGSVHGGGVNNDGTFVMNGGVITGNNSYSYAGGVCNIGTLILNGGEISGNTSEDGFGGGVGNMGTLVMSGGVIRDNTSSYGAGVSNSSGTFVMSGGVITGNTAKNDGSGVYGSVTLSGDPVITGNNGSNVYIWMNQVSFGGALTSGASIGVTHENYTDTITSGYSEYNSGTDPTAFFTSDNSDYTVALIEGEVKLVKAYKVALINNGGTYADGYTAPTSYAYGVGLTLPTAAEISMDGYLFEGWYAHSGFYGDAVTEISATDSGDKTYYAKWTVDTAALDSARADARTELENYKNASDYRTAQQTELANAITAGKDAIDAAEDADAVATALANAKTAIDAIKTDAQLTAEEAAAAPAAPAEVVIQDLPAVKISKPAAGKKKMTVKWKKVTKKNLKKIQGIEIEVATDAGFTNIVKSTTAGKKKVSKMVKGLKSKTKYWVRIRAYRNAADGKHISVWKTKKIKIK